MEEKSTYNGQPRRDNSVVIHDGRTLPIFIHSVVDDSDLSPNDLRVYMHLARRAGRGSAWPSYQGIGDHCFGMVFDNPVTRRSVARKCIANLLQAGLIRKVGRSDGKVSLSNHYILVDLNGFQPAAKPTDEGGVPIGTGGVPITPGGVPIVHQRYSNRSYSNKNTSLREVDVQTAAHLAPAVEIEQEVLPLFANEDAPECKESTAKKAPAKKPSTGYVNETTGASTADIQTFYVAALQEHEPGAVVNFGQTGRAAKALAQAGWTAVDAMRCYVDMKREPFYQGRHLSLSEVAKQIGARIGKSSPPQTAPAAPKEGIRSKDGRKVLALCQVRGDTILRLKSDADLVEGDRIATLEDVQVAAAKSEMTVDDFLARKFYGQITRGE